jgi:hypothetical protein
MSSAMAFLTEAPDQTPEERERRLKQEFEAIMGAPRENAGKMLDCADQLNDKMKLLLEKERHEFVAAYRAHTKRIQEELAHLRARVAEEQESLHRDERFRRLQADRDTFRAEALALDAGNTALAKELEDMKGKLEVVEDDRNFLVRSLNKARLADGAAGNDNDHNDDAGLRPESAGRARKPPRKGKDGKGAGVVVTETALDTASLLKSLKDAIGEAPGTPVLPSIGTPGGMRGATPGTTRLGSPTKGGGNLGGGTGPVGGDGGGKAERDEAGLRSELKALARSRGEAKASLETMTRRVAQVQQRRQANWLEALLIDCVRRVGDGIVSRRRVGGTVEAAALAAAGPVGGGAGSGGDPMGATDRVRGGQALSVTRLARARELRWHFSSAPSLVRAFISRAPAPSSCDLRWCPQPPGGGAGRMGGGSAAAGPFHGHGPRLGPHPSPRRPAGAGRPRR